MTKKIANLKPDLRPIGMVLVVVLGFALARGQSAPQTSAAAPSLRADVPISSTSVPELSTGSANAEEYVISPEDILSVYVYDVPELSRDYVVGTAGRITVPLLTKPLQAAGLSLAQFSRLLEGSFRETGVLSHPQVSVDVKQSRRSVISVEGAVKNPQVVPVIGRTRLLSVLDQCGGLVEDAGNNVKVTLGSGRGGGGEAGSVSMPSSSVIVLDAKKLTDANDPTSSFEVWPGDRVSVERAGLFYVLGEVNRPGGYNLKSSQEQITVLQALAIAGDVTSIAKKDKAKIIRKDPKAPDGRLELALNVKDIIAGRSPDQILQTNDVLFIPVSGAKRVGRTFTSSATSIVGGAGTVIYRR